MNELSAERRRADRRRFRVAAVVGLLLHGALAVAVWGSPPPDVPEAAPDRRFIEVRTARRPPPEPPRPPDPPKPPEPEPPKPEPPKPEPPKPPEPAPTPDAPPSAPGPASPDTSPSRDPAPKDRTRVRKTRRKAKRAGKATRKMPKTLQGVKLSGPGHFVGGDEDSPGGSGPTDERETGPDTGPRGDGGPGSGGSAPKAGGGGKRAEGARPAEKLVPPKLVKVVKGRYPAKAPRDLGTVRITLSLKLDRKGVVRSARVVGRSRGAGRLFDAEAVRAAKRLGFRPAMRGATAVPFTLRFMVEFEP